MKKVSIKTEQLGFVLFEIEPISGTVYETLASPLSSALKGAKLVSKRKRRQQKVTVLICILRNKPASK